MSVIKQASVIDTATLPDNLHRLAIEFFKDSAYFGNHTYHKMYKCDFIDMEESGPEFAKYVQSMDIPEDQEIIFLVWW